MCGYFNGRLGVKSINHWFSVHTSFTCIASTTDIKLSTHQTVSKVKVARARWWLLLISSLSIHGSMSLEFSRINGEKNRNTFFFIREDEGY
jgi:hypothetical protein